MPRRTGVWVAVAATALVGLAVPGHAHAASPVPLPCATALLPRPMNGAAAVTALGSAGLTRAASTNRTAGSRLAAALRADHTLWLDRCGKQFYVEPADAAPAAGAPAGEAAPYPYSQTFTLHSRPGSQRTIYLDFTGAYVAGTAWNAAYTGGAAFTAHGYDTDGNPASFSTAEQAVIQSAWQRIAEDYAPFDVDVTTQDPGADAITRSSSTDQVYGTRLVISDDPGPGRVDCGCGGIAYVGVFGLSGSHDYYQPAFVFSPGDAKDIAEAGAHEVGHTLGLHHDGTTSGSSYYSGQGAWAPIMGVGYYHPISQWSRGEYAGANNTEDDLATIASNGAPLRPDDHGDSAATATALDPATLTATGVIGTASDTDWFSFTGGGATTVTVSPAPAGPDLDASLSVYDAAGTRIAAVDPASAQAGADLATGLGATYTATNLPAGTYYLAVDGVGSGDPATTGYSDYASLGQYTVTVHTSTYRPPVVATTRLPDAIVGVPYRATLTGAYGTPPYAWDVAASALPSWLTLSADGALSGTPPQAGTVPVQPALRDAQGTTATGALELAAVADPGPLAISTGELPALTVLHPVTVSLAASGADGPPGWSVSAGALPAGLSLSSSGTLTGAPAAAGTTLFTVLVRDATDRTTARTLTATVAAPVGISTARLPHATSRGRYSARLRATGGTGRYTWALRSGTLPAGIALTAAGVLSGRPTRAGSYLFAATVRDSAGRSAARSYRFVVAARPSIRTRLLPAGQRSHRYATRLVAAGGTTSYRWTLRRGGLPRGLSLTRTGRLRGVPHAAGRWSFTVQLTDRWQVPVRRTYTLRIR